MATPTGNTGLRNRILLAVIVLACTILAFKLRFVQDDALISFRYAQNLADGRGLVWNPGERVAGYTNFLWTVMLSIPFAVHFSPVVFTYVVGLACFVTSLLLLYAIARRVLDSENAALLSVLLTGLNYSFALYGTGGLETPLVAVLWMACLYFAVPLLMGDTAQVRQLVFLSLASVAALLTRLDSAVFLTVLQAAILLRWAYAKQLQLPKLFALLVPEALIFAAWSAWQVSYYGNLLPNTFYLKISGESSSVRYLNGLHFVEQFFLKYLFVLMLVFLPFHLRKLFRSPALATLLTIAVAWCGYIVYAGGDFMEYRFFVGLIPVLTILFVWSALRMKWNIGAVGLGLAFLAAVGPWSGVEIFPEYFNVESRAQLIAHLNDPRQDWEGIGKLLDRVFQHDPRVSIAVNPAGAIPFYSELPCIDMLGLNDAWVARHGKPYLPVPGHYRIAPLRYLLDRRAGLLIQQPTLVSHDGPLLEHYAAGQVLDAVICDGRCALPPEAKVLRIPLDDKRDLQVVYVFPNAVVDAAILKYHWRVSRIVN